MPNNIAPIYNPNGAWQVWNYNDVYTGPSGFGQYVPKVGDQVNQIVGNVVTSFVVTAVNLGNMLVTLSELSPPTGQGDLTISDVLFGVGPSQSETYIVYIDKAVVPYRMMIDGRYTVKGSLITAAKVFAGSDISTTGKVISATYDNAGVYSGENMTLELVAAAALNNNTAIKAVVPCFTSADLPDGEIVTAVFYDTLGSVVSKRQMVVENTGFVRSSNAYAKAVVGVSLATPFLSSSNSTTINYPVNLAMNIANLTAVVHYSDGSSVSSAIDGVKFSISGLDSYIATNVGQSFPLVLTYVLQPGEVSYGINNVNQPHVAKTYNLITSAANLSYKTRLFAYPVWVNNTAGYTLKWYLYDMNRSQATDVTGQVSYSPGSVAYNPTLYGTKQTLTATLNLMYVNGAYGTFNYSQNVDIVLEAPGTFRQNSATPPNWYVTPIAGTQPQYGGGNFATFYNVAVGNNQVKLSGIYTTFAAWLASYFTNSMPLVNTPTETSAPSPTHFNIRVGGGVSTYPITSWNSTITLAQNLSSNDTLFIEFFVRTANADLQLSVAGVPLYAVNAIGTYI